VGVFIVYLRQPAKKNPKKAANMGLCSGKLRKCAKKKEHVLALLVVALGIPFQLKVK